jgi:threonine aldolase
MTKSPFIDLRSDTVTSPSKEMLEAMMAAETGDDVFDEDPTVKLLERKAAALFGKEAGLFVPSGTMANQIAIRLHTQLQDEIICDRLSHIYYYESGGTFSNSGVSVRLLNGDRGRITADLVEENLNDPAQIYLPVSSMVCLENTCNKGGGSYYNLNEIERIASLCKNHSLKLYVDGARIFNALTETGEKPDEYGRLADTLSFCFSKGLGAPVGSVLLTSAQNLNKAKRIRKAFGGGMRQAGYLAAACNFALDNNIGRLKEDHARAKELGKCLAAINWVEELIPVDTNIIVFRLAAGLTVKKILDQLSERNIKAVPFGHREIRMVTHLDFTDKMLEQVISAINKLKV